MHPEKYSLTWHTYSDHLKNMMKELMINEDFSDVTLATEDKKQIKANISILSACSPVFQDILKKDRHSTPIMYLRGIQYSEMESILQFIYLGEATFYEERMNEFLAVAKSLEIKELCNAESETNDEAEEEPLPESSNGMTEETVTSEHIEKQPPRERRQVVSANGKHECKQCDKTFSSSPALWYHKNSKHDGVKYACKHCDYQTAYQSNLTAHIKYKHEGVRYACEQCDYQAGYQSDLRKHIQSKHKAYIQQ